MPELDRAAWLAERRKGIGGSDAAAILGLSEWSSPYCVWADKLGLLPEKEDTEAMRQGRDLEEYVASRFAQETGLAVRRDSRTIRNPLYPYSFAHIDRRIVGKRAGLECKTCSPFRQDAFSDGKYPNEYYAQCLHYLAVTGFDVWYLAVLMWSTSFTVYEIRREDVLEDMCAVQAKIESFWESHVLTRIPPPMDGKEATTRALNEVYRAACEGSVELPQCEDDFIELARLKGDIEQLQRQQEFHKQNIKLAMGTHERALCGAWVANWKPRRDGVRVFIIKEAI